MHWFQIRWLKNSGKKRGDWLKIKILASPLILVLGFLRNLAYKLIFVLGFLGILKKKNDGIYYFPKKKKLYIEGFLTGKNISLGVISS